MPEKQTKVLLISSSRYVIPLVEGRLAEAKGVPFHMEHTKELSEGFQILSERKFDVVVLDSNMLGSHGFEELQRVNDKVPVVMLDLALPSERSSESVFFRVHKKTPEVPIVRLTDFGNKYEEVHILIRSMWYAIERYRTLMEIRTRSIVDELTGLYNRRGFLALTEQHIKLADRKEMPFFLLFSDLDNMKAINDTMGHHSGDEALVDTANIHKETFRTSDIIARIGGDEFTAIMIDTDKTIGAERLDKKIEEFNVNSGRPYKLSLSVGLAYYDPKRPCTLGELLSEADALMYQQKEKKHAKRGK